MHIRISSFYEYHDLAYKIFKIGSFSYKTVFLCLVELPTKCSKGTCLEMITNTFLHRL